MEVGDQPGRYRILTSLEKGGTGEVFPADETTLKHKFTAKFLPGNFSVRIIKSDSARQKNDDLRPARQFDLVRDPRGKNNVFARP
jgi:hypothetical protein